MCSQSGVMDHKKFDSKNFSTVPFLSQNSWCVKGTLARPWQISTYTLRPLFLNDRHSMI